MIGQAAWDALTPAEKTAKRGALPDDKIEAARANVALALDVIKCINAAVADCVRKTWEKGRLCIDFKSKGASGSILPNCAGKVAGCDPDNNPINIAFTTDFTEGRAGGSSNTPMLQSDPRARTPAVGVRPPRIRFSKIGID